MKYVFSLMIALTFGAAYAQQACDNLKNIIRTKSSLEIATKISNIAPNFLDKYDRGQLDLLQCALNLLNKRKDAKDKKILLDIIAYLKENIGEISSLLSSKSKELKIYYNPLIADAKRTNELYIKYMQVINENTKLSPGKKITLTKPATIFPGYEQFLRAFKEGIRRSATGVYNFLLVQGVLSENESENPRKAQALYDFLNQLEIVLLETNKQSYNLYANSTRKQQILLIQKIKDGLKEKYGDIVLLYTTLPSYFYEKLTISEDKDSVVFASVALALNTIINSIYNKFLLALQRIAVK